MNSFVKQIDPQKLRKARIAANLVQKQIGAKIGVGRAMVRHFERGYARLNADQLAQWAAACNVEDIDTLYSFAPPNAFYIREKRLEKSLT